MTDIQDTSAKNGHEIAQSHADTLELARQFGLAGFANAELPTSEESAADTQVEGMSEEDPSLALAKTFGLAGIS